MPITKEPTDHIEISKAARKQYEAEQELARWRSEEMTRAAARFLRQGRPPETVRAILQKIVGRYPHRKFIDAAVDAARKQVARASRRVIPFPAPENRW